jgi:toxin ParE1/3/4
MLARHPRMGRTAHSIAPGLRRHEHGAHVVLYLEEEAGILVVAVVHGASMRRLQV